MAKLPKISRFIKWLYAKFVRPVIFSIIDNPNSEIDEKVLEWLDKLFKYKQNGT